MEEAVRNEVSKAFCLSPLLFSYPCTHFSSWDTCICGNVILQKKLSSHLFHFFYFALTPFSCQELIKSIRHKILNPLTAWRPVYFLPFFGFQTLWIVGWKNVLSYAFSVGYPDGSHSSLACCSKHSLIYFTHWRLLLIYKNQPPKSM